MGRNCLCLPVYVTKEPSLTIGEYAYDDNLFERVGAVILLVFDMKKSIKFYIFLIKRLIVYPLSCLKLQYSVYCSSSSVQF